MIREQCIKAHNVVTSLVHVTNVLPVVGIQRLNCCGFTMMVSRIFYKYQCKGVNRRKFFLWYAISLGHHVKVNRFILAKNFSKIINGCGLHFVKGKATLHISGAGLKL